MNLQSTVQMLAFGQIPNDIDELWQPVVSAVELVQRRNFTRAYELLQQCDSADDGLLGFSVSITLLRVATGRGDIVGGARLAEVIRNHPLSSEPLLAALANFRIGAFLRVQSDLDLALNLQLAAGSYFSEIGWMQAKALCDAEVANILMVRGDYSAASAAYLKLAEVFQDEPLLEFRAPLLANTAAAMQRAGKIDEAREIYEEVLLIPPFDTLNADRGIILQNLALNQKLRHRYKEAEATFNEALSCITEQEAPSQFVRIHNSLADLAMRRGDVFAAKQHVRLLDQIDPSILPPMYLVEALSTRAQLLTFDGKHDQAVSTILEGLSLADSKGLIDECHSLLEDALQWATQSNHRLVLLEEYRRIQDVRVTKAADSMNSIVELRTHLEQERARREIERQQELSRVILETQSRTMGEISRELHDSLGQDMTVLQKLSERLLNNAQLMDDPDNSRIASTIYEVSQRAALDTRRIAHLMSGSGVSAEGLSDAIALLRSEMSEAIPSLEMEVSISGDLSSMSFDKVRVIYRIIQTSMQNVVRHADASSCCVNLIAHDDHYHLSIEDNGKGFDPVTVKRGIGLREIKARVELIGGNVRIESMPGNGAYIEVTIPRDGR